MIKDRVLERLTRWRHVLSQQLQARRWHSSPEDVMPRPVQMQFALVRPIAGGSRNSLDGRWSHCEIQSSQTKKENEI
jgi:hypothetical protein